MVPKLRDILDALEQIAPLHTAEDWDNPGLQVGYISQEIQKIFISLDPTIDALREASRRKAQLLITHHPLIFKSLSTINQKVYPGEVICEALKKDISIVASHTNLDVVQGGINDMLANLFGLEDIEVLQRLEDSGISNAGLGRIGYLSEPVRLSAMTDRVKGALGAERVKVVGSENIKIRRVAVVGGSGGGMVPLSSQREADLLITGDVRHHEALEAKTLGLAVIDAGHFYSEKAPLWSFANFFQDTLSKRGWEISVEVYKDEKNPMRFE